MFSRLGVWSKDGTFNFVCGGTTDEMEAYVRANLELNQRIPGFIMMLAMMLARGKDRIEQFGDYKIYLNIEKEEKN